MITFTTKSGVTVTCKKDDIREIRDICNEILDATCGDEPQFADNFAASDAPAFPQSELPIYQRGIRIAKAITQGFEEAFVSITTVSPFHRAIVNRGCRKRPVIKLTK